jgi:hypothetical protein
MRVLASGGGGNVMDKKVDPIPREYHAITPDLTVTGASAAIEFYKKAMMASQ